MSNVLIGEFIGTMTLVDASTASYTIITNYVSHIN